MQTFLEATEIPAEAAFVRSSRSGAAGHCVEVAELGSGVALRHGKDTGRGALLFSAEEMSAFVPGAKDGEFDHLV